MICNFRKSGWLRSVELHCSLLPVQVPAALVLSTCPLLSASDWLCRIFCDPSVVAASSVSDNCSEWGAGSSAPPPPPPLPRQVEPSSQNFGFVHSALKEKLCFHWTCGNDRDSYDMPALFPKWCTISIDKYSSSVTPSGLHAWMKRSEALNFWIYMETSSNFQRPDSGVREPYALSAPCDGG